MSLPARLLAQRFVNTDFLASQLLNTQESLGAADERVSLITKEFQGIIKGQSEEIQALKSQV